MSQPESLRQATDQRVRSSRLAVAAAIQELVESGGSLSVANVARRAGVSMTYIHNHAELKDEILRLRAERRNAPGPRHRVRREVSPALTLEEENRRLRRQVAELEARVQDLRAVLWGGVRP